MLTRSKELVALAMIGDGLLGLVQTDRHFRLWTVGPAPARKAIRFFHERPLAAKALSALELGVGLYLATRQTPQRAARDKGTVKNAIKGALHLAHAR